MNHSSKPLSAPGTWLVLGCLASSACQSTAVDPPAPQVNAAPLARRYDDGQRLVYEMTAVNQDRVKTLRYSAVASAVVHDGAGGFVEEIDWSALVVDGKPVALPPSGAGIHQQVSLAAGYRWSVPDMAKAPSSGRCWT